MPYEALDSCKYSTIFRGMYVAMHMVVVCKEFMHQHSASLARVFCAHLKEYLKTTLIFLNHVARSNLLAVEDGLYQKVFWCFLLYNFFVFLVDATKENQ